MPRRGQEELPMTARQCRRRDEHAARKRRIAFGLLGVLPFVIAIAVLVILHPERTKTIDSQSAEDLAPIDGAQESDVGAELDVPMLESDSSTPALVLPNITEPTQSPFEATQLKEEAGATAGEESSMLFTEEATAISPTGAEYQTTKKPSAPQTTDTIFDSAQTGPSASPTTDTLYSPTTIISTSTSAASVISEITGELDSTLSTAAAEPGTNSSTSAAPTAGNSAANTTAPSSTTTTMPVATEQSAAMSTSTTSTAGNSTANTTTTSSTTTTMPVATEQSAAMSTSTITSATELADAQQSMLSANETLELSTSSSSATISSSENSDGIFSNSTTFPATEQAASAATTVSISEVSNEILGTDVIEGISSEIPLTEQISNGTLSTQVSVTEVSDGSDSTLPIITTSASTLDTTTLTTTSTTSSLTVTTTTSIDFFPYPLPAIRFQPFYQLDESSQTIVTSQLGYTPVTWDSHGFDPIEESSWSELDSDEQDGARQLGFDTYTWDCFIDHYRSFSWDQLEEINVRDSMQVLGWTRDLWGSGLSNPTYEDNWWYQLSYDEQLAANAICYYEKNWNPIDMNYNPSYFPYAVPEFRYMPWDQLPSATRQIARYMMNYDEIGWNSLIYRAVAFERRAFWNMDRDERDGARFLGFYPSQWDCFMSHYDTYEWTSLPENAKLAYETLGWDENSWDDGDCDPISEDTDWNDLTPTERGAVTMVCYFEEIWDEEPVTQWYDYLVGANTAVSADQVIPNCINMAKFEELRTRL